MDTHNFQYPDHRVYLWSRFSDTKCGFCYSMGIFPSHCAIRFLAIAGVLFEKAGQEKVRQKF